MPTRLDNFTALEEAVLDGELRLAIELAKELNYPTLVSALKIELDARTFVSQQLALFSEYWAGGKQYDP